MFSPGQRLLRSGQFAQLVRPAFRLDGQILEVVLANGSTRLVNAKDAIATDWDGVERRVRERRQGERRRVRRRLDPRLDFRKQGERRQRDRRQFSVAKKAPPIPRRA